MFQFQKKKIANYESRTDCFASFTSLFNLSRKFYFANEFETISYIESKRNRFYEKRKKNFLITLKIMS